MEERGVTTMAAKEDASRKRLLRVGMSLLAIKR